MRKIMIPPEVLKHKPPKTTITYVNGKYYLYGVTSKRVKGKKYPLTTRTYIGTIDALGIHKGTKGISVDETHVYEYGYSMFLYQVCKRIKDTLQKYFDDYDDIYKHLIAKCSFNSIFKEITVTGDYTYHHNKLKTMSKEFKENIECLKGIYLVKSGKNRVVSYISIEAKEILDKYGVIL